VTRPTEVAIAEARKQVEKGCITIFDMNLGQPLVWPSTVKALDALVEAVRADERAILLDDRHQESYAEGFSDGVEEGMSRKLVVP
jgi:hypothetical protein